MKIILSVLLVIAFAGCLLFGIAFTSAQSEANNVKTQLMVKESEMTVVQVELDDKNAELARVQQDLTDTETNLNQTMEGLTAAEAELSQAKFDLTDTTHQLDNATSKNTQMTDEYTSLRELINRKTGNQADSQLYVTPDDPEVATVVLDVAGEFATNINQRWRDFRNLYDWVVDNITYNYDTPIPLLPSALDANDEIEWFAEYWKTPAETLTDANGDCEDMANLLASLILNYNNQVNAVWLIEIQGYDSGHVAVALPVTGDQIAILDPAGNYYTGTTNNYLQSEDISAEINNWLAYWSTEIPGAEVTAVYSIDFNEEFSSTQEFIDWAIDKYAD